jgi:hypothetical protein
MMDVNALSELIGAGFGLLTSVGFKLIPQLDDWLYNKVSANNRGYVMLGLSALVPLIILGVSCVGLYDLIPCQVSIWKDLLRGWVAFMIANQGLFLVTGDSPAKTENKALEKNEVTRLIVEEVMAEVELHAETMVNTQMREGSE